MALGRWTIVLFALMLETYAQSNITLTSSQNLSLAVQCERVVNSMLGYVTCNICSSEIPITFSTVIFVNGSSLARQTTSLAGCGNFSADLPVTWAVLPSVAIIWVSTLTTTVSDTFMVAFATGLPRAIGAFALDAGMSIGVKLDAALTDAQNQKIGGSCLSLLSNDRIFQMNLSSCTAMAGYA
jgi:hypothetical protein